MYVCLYVCLYVCMYVCMYVYTHAYAHTCCTPIIIVLLTGPITCARAPHTFRPHVLNLLEWLTLAAASCFASVRAERSGLVLCGVCCWLASLCCDCCCCGSCAGGTGGAACVVAGTDSPNRTTCTRTLPCWWLITAALMRGIPRLAVYFKSSSRIFLHNLY